MRVSPEKASYDYQYNRGEFSDRAYVAFEKHIYRLYLKTNGKATYEPFWHPYKPSFFEEADESEIIKGKVSISVA